MVHPQERPKFPLFFDAPTGVVSMEAFGTPFQYPMRRFIVKISRRLKAAKFVFIIVRSLWHSTSTLAALLTACLSNFKANLGCQSRIFETLRDLTIRRLIRYWNGAHMSSIPLGSMGTGSRQSMKKNHAICGAPQHPVFSKLYGHIFRWKCVKLKCSKCKLRLQQVTVVSALLWFVLPCPYLPGLYWNIMLTHFPLWDMNEILDKSFPANLNNCWLGYFCK